MSVRIYQLAKELQKDSKEVLELLKSKGFAVSTVSSTISNIDAEAFLEELAPKKKEIIVANKRNLVPEQEQKDPIKDESAPAVTLKMLSQPEMPSLDPERFVKNKEDIERERAQRQPYSPPRAFSEPTSFSKAQESRAPIMPSFPRSSQGPGIPRAPFVPLINSSKRDLTKMGTAPLAPSIPISPEKVKPIEEASLKPLVLKPPIVVREFAQLLGVKPFRIISELMEVGIFASMSQSIELEVAIQLARKHGFALAVQQRPEPMSKGVAPSEAKKAAEDLIFEPRPPVVCVLGHVDHGKTTFLDYVRRARVAKGEAGGITQHIGAYQADYNGKTITFLDTPGHAAFTKIRERGAQVTDIAILIVAADDGFMPQTDEALKFIQRAKVPLIVAINKMDAKGANIPRVQQQMQQRNIAPESLGGDVLSTGISALTGTNIDELLELVLLQAEMMEIKSCINCPAEGVVIETQQEIGLGATATVILQKGILKPGQYILSDEHFCRIRSLLDDKNKNISQAKPSQPVRIVGWNSVVEVGARFHIVANEKLARSLAEEYQRDRKASASREKMGSTKALFDAIASTQKRTLKLTIKGDTFGSIEAIEGLIKEIKSDKVDVQIIDSDVGPVSQKDIHLAKSSEAVIIAFNVKLETGVQNLAKHDGVDIIKCNIIYELVDQVKEAMKLLLDPEFREHKLGVAEIRQVFELPRGFVAGCMITEGKVVRDAKVRIWRAKEKVFEGGFSSIKRVKEDVNEVRAGYECGLMVAGFNAYQKGDLIECYELEKYWPEI